MARVSLLCLVEFVSLTLGFLELDRSHLELRNITQLEEALPSYAIRQGVTLLNISDNYLVELSGDWDLPNLTHLDAASNEILDTDADFLCFYPRLARLDLSGNRLGQFPSACKAPGSLLQHLDLSHNRIEHLSAKALDDFPLLENLSLDGNNLTAIGGLMALKASLVRLDLNEANLYELEFNVSEFSKLEQLGLADNYLDQLLVCGGPDALLVELNLAGNRLRRIPDLWCVGRTLTDLVLAGNRLATVADLDLGNLTALRHLDLSYNRLTSLELCLDRAVNGLNGSLEDLLADHNQLTGRQTQVGCGSVYELTLSANPLVEWPDVHLMTSLERLDLNETQLASAPSGVLLARLTRVAELTLANNSLTWTHVSGLVLTPVSVRMINLFGNRLQEIELFHLCESSLEEIIIANNQITCLPEITCDTRHPVNVTIDLRSNPLMCDCCMAWLKQYEYEYRTEITVNKDQITCPYDDAFFLWEEITPDYFSYCTASSTSFPEEAKSTTSTNMFIELISAKDPDVIISTTKMTTTTRESHDTKTLQQTADLLDTNTASAAPSTLYTTTDYSFVLSWNQWTEWSECTKSCGGGTQMRLLLCADGATHNCSFILDHEKLPYDIGYKYEESTCSISPCPIDGVWLSWQPWSDCSATCGQGTNQRQRFCNGPVYEGKPCEGVEREFTTCYIEDCTASGATLLQRKRELLPEVTYTESDERVSSISVGTVATLVLAGVVLVVFGLDFQVMKTHVIKGVERATLRRR